MKLIKKRTAKRMGAILLSAMMVISMSGKMGMATATQLDVGSKEAQVLETGDDTDSKTNVDANGTLGTNSDIGMEVKKSVIGTAGQKLTLSFAVNSNDYSNIALKSVYPVVDKEFPFETSGDAYKISFAKSDDDKKKMNLKYKMVVASALTTGYHSTNFVCEYTKLNNDGTVGNYYVIKTINIYFNGTDDADTPNSSDKDDDDDDDDWSPNPGGTSSPSYDDDDDDYDYGHGGGSGSSGSSTVPKLVITGFDTNPKKVMAGDKFTLTVHIQNTAKGTSVKNAKFMVGNEAGSILPASGSSSVFVDEIGPGKTGDLKIEMKTNADLAQKSYVLVVKGDFDDNSGTNYTYSESLYLPVFQEVKLAVTDANMTPEAIGIGDQGQLMFTISNQGSASVYNVNVSVDDASVQADPVYVGNVAASGSAYASLNVTGVEDNSDKGTIQVVISYEDSEGNTEELKQEIACFVGEDVFADMGEADEMEMEDEDSGFGFVKIIVIIVIVLFVLVAIAVVVILLIKRRKKMLAALEAEDDEVDFDDEDI